MNCAFYPSIAFCWWETAPGYQRTCVMVGGVCSFIAVALSIALIIAHRRSSEPSVIRISIIRIIWLVPAFSLEAAACLLDPKSQLHYSDIIYFFRELYEGVVLVAFVNLVLNSLHGPVQVASDFSAHMQKPQHPFIFKRIPTPFPPGLRFLVWNLWGILQFAVAMLIVTIVGVVIWAGGLITQSDPKLMATLHMIPMGIKWLSSGCAMYVLLVFYFELLRNEDLKPKFRALEPELKFACLKGAIVIPLMQEFGAVALAYFGFFDNIRWVGAGGQVAAEEAAAGILSFVVSIEMFLFSVAYWFAYRPGREVALTDCATGICGMLREVRELTKQADLQRSIVSEISSVRGVPEARLETVFNVFTLDSRDTISEQEFRYVLECAGFKQQAINELLAKGDRDSDQRITFQEFRVAFSEARAAP